jgi:hypothetical protein
METSGVGERKVLRGRIEVLEAEAGAEMSGVGERKVLRGGIEVLGAGISGTGVRFLRIGPGVAGAGIGVVEAKTGARAVEAREGVAREGVAREVEARVAGARTGAGLEPVTGVGWGLVTRVG